MGGFESVNLWGCCLLCSCEGAGDADDVNQQNTYQVFDVCDGWGEYLLGCMLRRKCDGYVFIHYSVRCGVPMVWAGMLVKRAWECTRKTGTRSKGLTLKKLMGIVHAKNQGLTDSEAS